ncbi:MAG: sugar phosphate isomerase/epimerase [Clostridia bacterium]|nr:sugar phosphate isomerase/epimerase [Clostridia bacterium]
MRELGINLRAAQGITVEDYTKKIAELGFKCTFCSTTTVEEMRPIADAVHAAGLTFDQLHAPFRGINAMWLAGEEGEVMYGKLTAAIDCCVAFGAPIATVHLSSGPNPPTITDIGRGRYENLVEYAAQKGIKIAFENQRKLFNIAWAFDYFRDAENVGFCWDCGHEACATPDIEFMPLFGKRLICTHMQDNDAVFGEDLHKLPFDGKVDFGRVARQLNGAGYTGSLMLEVENGAPMYQDFSAEQFLERAWASACRLCELVEA